MNKDDIRGKIDSLDTKILDLLEERISCAKAIGKIKLEKGEEVYVPSREAQVFAKLLEKNNGRLSEESVRAIYREIISASISAEKKLQVSYLGPVATFTQQAATKNFGSCVDYKAMPSIPDIFASVDLGESDYGVIPIENSTEGAVFHSMDMLAESNLLIVGQIYLPIEHCLISRGNLSGIRKVCSKDQAIGQCRNWLRRNLPNVEIEYVESTGIAVKMAQENPEIAAVASAIASDYYGVPVVEKAIQDKTDNVTRFLVIGKNPTPYTSNINYKTSVVLSLNDRPGALSEVLIPFNKANINLTKIESRPSRKKAWDYLFFIDFQGHWEDQKIKETFNNLKQTLPMVKWLGSYPMTQK